MATIVTPGRTAPLLSATLPLICAVAWAHALVVARSRRSTPTKVPRVRFIQGLLTRRFTNRRAVYPLTVRPVLLFLLADREVDDRVPGVVDADEDESEDRAGRHKQGVFSVPR